MRTVLLVVVVILSVTTLLKCAFFLIPYPARRAMMDRSFAPGRAGHARTDGAVRLVAVFLAIGLFAQHRDAVAVLGGVWLGSTSTQLMLHRFDAPSRPGRTPEGTTSPIRLLAYAIQDRPVRAMPEIAMTAAIIAAGLFGLCAGW